MKPLSPTRILCALGLAPHLSVLLLTNLSSTSFPCAPDNIIFLRQQLFRTHSRVPCTTAQSGHTSTPLLPTIEFA